MLQSIKEKNDQIGLYFTSNFHLEDRGQEYFKAIIQEFNVCNKTKLKESCRDLNIWFKAQFNEEILVNFMYSRLQILRALNHDVQSQEIEEKYGMVQITNQLCNSQCSEFQIIYNEYLQHSQVLDEELLNLENAFSNQKDIPDNHLPSKRKYSFEKIIYLYQFELDSLKGYNLQGELLCRLNNLDTDSTTLWILGIVQSKIVIQRKIKEINEICQQFLSLDVEQLTKIVQKQKLEQLSIDSQLSKINTAPSIEHYKSQFKQQTNMLIRKTESQLPKPKSCMCPIY